MADPPASAGNDARLVSTSYRRSGHGDLVFAVLLLMLVEGVVHVLLVRWSPTLAGIAVFLSFYGALWVVADYRATVQRPHLGNEAEAWIRAGFRWHARVTRQQIASVERVPPKAGERARTLTFPTAPNLWIRFSAPVELERRYGIRRKARCVGQFVDEPTEFQRLLT